MVRLPKLLAVLAPSIIGAVLAANVTVYQAGVNFVPTPLPAPGPASNFEEIIAKFNDLGRTTTWKLVKRVQLEGDTGEPEGIVVLNEERYLLSRGNWTERTQSYGNGTRINGTDRTAGAGYAHLNIYDGEGSRIADVTLTPPGEIEYHIGGVDYDGEKIWATLSQYRPNSTATIISIDPITLEHQNVIRYNDHLGGIVHDRANQRLTTLNWGSRNASIWSLKYPNTPYPDFATPKTAFRNPSFYVDYQDCKFLGHSRVYSHRPVMMCGGVTTLAGNVTIGGLAIVDTQTMIPLSEVPLTMRSDSGGQITQNPFDVAIVDGKLRVYLAPEQHNTTVYVYETA